MVERCGGSCYTPPYTCISNLTSLHTVEVMLVQSKWPHGEHDVRCSEVEVEAPWGATSVMRSMPPLKFYFCYFRP